MQIRFNKSPRTQKIKYIVIHDTANTKAGANAIAHFNYFNTGDRQSSADFFVDSTQVLQVNDYYKYYTWHCGDGYGKNGITNANSIGIEICVNSDGDYDEALKKTVQLTKELRKNLNLTQDNIVTHHDASGKNCPSSMSKDNWNSWKQFKREVFGLTEYTDPNDIVWELKNRGLITDSEGMLEEMKKDLNGRLYWLARKVVQHLRESD